MNIFFTFDHLFIFYLILHILKELFNVFFLSVFLHGMFLLRYTITVLRSITFDNNVSCSLRLKIYITGNVSGKKCLMAVDRTICCARTNIDRLCYSVFTPPPRPHVNGITEPKTDIFFTEADVSTIKLHNVISNGDSDRASLKLCIK